MNKQRKFISLGDGVELDGEPSTETAAGRHGFNRFSRIMSGCEDRCVSDGYCCEPSTPGVTAVEGVLAKAPSLTLEVG